MKHLKIGSKPLVITIMLLCFHLTTLGCTVCGCGAGSFYTGLSPNFASNAVSLRYRQFGFNSHLLYSPLYRTQEHFVITDLMARYYLHPKWQLNLTIPYQFNSQTTNSQVFRKQGLGDLSTLIQYNLVNRQNSLNGISIKHQLWMGAGAKLPSGAYKINTANPGEVNNPNFQLGTGSTDLVAQLQYLVRTNKTGLLAQANYRFNGTNSNKYAFGNQLFSNLSIFRILQINEIGISIQGGLYYEDHERHISNNFYVKETGGYSFGALTAVSVFYKRVGLDIQYQIPISQRWAEGQFTSRPMVLVQGNYYF